MREQNLETYTLRELHLSRDPPGASNAKATAATSDSKSGFLVYHYQFHAWPDHGTPSDPSCVLNFMFDISKRMVSFVSYLTKKYSKTSYVINMRERNTWRYFQYHIPQKLIRNVINTPYSLDIIVHFSCRNRIRSQMTSCP